MEHEIKITEEMKVGGFDYKIKMGEETNRELESQGLRGAHSDLLKSIEVRDDMTPQCVSATFIHESIHAVEIIYGITCLEEKDVVALSHGIHQILEQFGIRFVKG